MRTTSKQLNAKVQQYLIAAIDSDGYDISAETELEKLQFLADTFKSEYLYPENVQRYRTTQNVLKNWIAGLPSCFNIDFYDFDIIRLGKEWGALSEAATEKQEDKFITEWFGRIAANTLMLFKKHNIRLTDEA